MVSLQDNCSMNYSLMLVATPVTLSQFSGVGFGSKLQAAEKVRSSIAIQNKIKEVDY
jgi:hypothetical protein